MDVSQTYAFVDSILQNPHLQSSVVNVQKRSFFLLLQGLVSVIIGVYLLAFKKQEIVTVLDTREKVKKMLRSAKLRNITTGCILLVNAYQLYYTYKPTNSEISLAILLKFLRQDRILPPNVYETLKKFKPYRIEKLSI